MFVSHVLKFIAAWKPSRGGELLTLIPIQSIQVGVTPCVRRNLVTVVVDIFDTGSLVFCVDTIAP